MRDKFSNEPFTDFREAANHRDMDEALAIVAGQFGMEYPMRIGGKRLDTGKLLPSINPAKKEQLIGAVSSATPELASQAVDAAAEAFRDWKRTKPSHRARILYKAAALLRRRKLEFNAWLVFEAGKPWQEADADTAEAIDFLEFYGREAERLAELQPLVRLPVEDNELTYIPLGVGAVISPWNFPLAIMAGMTAAAIVTGNTVVLKPASPTPVIAAKFLELMDEAGLPENIIQFIPGPGGEIGDVLVSHPLTRFVSFTGSREVGLRVNERAARTPPGQLWIKRVIAEMGGKDAILVDETADPELAAEAITSSAFGFSGQKCSACSRAIIHRDLYDDVLDRVVQLAGRLKVGDPADPSTRVGPVIDAHAHKKILYYMELARKEGQIVLGGDEGDPSGFFIQPTIVADVDPGARISREEIFGPLVAFTKADDFGQALAYANETEYGLTGAVFSRSRANLERAREEFHVGNLYFNRKCTGALVGAHPFGGFNLSGTDSKAGGRDYLLLFTQAKLVSEML